MKNLKIVTSLMFLLVFLVGCASATTLSNFSTLKATDDEASYYNPGIQYSGNSFKAIASGTANVITLWIKKAGTPTNTTYIYIANITNAASQPSLTDMTLVATYNTSSLPTSFEQVNITLNEATYPIVSGSYYYFGISGGGTDSGNTGVLKRNTDLPYADGGAWFYDGGTWTSRLTSYDINFVLLGTTISTIDVSLTDPVDDFHSKEPAIQFNATITPTSSNVSNSTMYIWNSNSSLFNTVLNTTVGTSAFVANWNISGFSVGSSYIWNVRTCSNESLCYWSISNRTFTSSLFTDGTLTYNTSTLETSNEYYELNISANPSVSSAAARLWYNGTFYPATVIDGGSGTYTASKSIDVQLSDYASANKQFKFEFTFTLTGGSTVVQNSTTQTQQVNRTYLVPCNSTYNIPYINYTTKSAENPFPILNATFKSAWLWYLGEGDITRNYSYEDVSELNSTFNFCMADPNRNFTVSNTVEIDATGYSKNFYFLTNATLGNSSTDYRLYLLNDSLATLTVLRVQDKAQKPLSNVLISIQMYDVGTDTFYTVGMAKTSTEGEDLIYLNWYDTLYKFILIQDGTVIKSTSPYKISETPQIFEVLTSTTFDFDKFRDFEYSLYFNDSTNNFVLTYIKPSGLVDGGCLRVIKRNQTGDTLICDSCESSSSATLYCNIAAYGNGTFIATFYATGSLKYIDMISKLIGISSLIYEELGNEDGTVLAILFAGIITALFLVNPIMGVLGVILGVLGSIAFGFQPMDYSVLIGFVLLGGVVIWLLKK